MRYALLSSRVAIRLTKAALDTAWGTGTRGVGSESSASAIWGVNRDEYIQKADPYPLNPDGELLLGIKIENVRGASNIEQILKVPGIGFAEMGPGRFEYVDGIFAPSNAFFLPKCKR